MVILTSAVKILTFTNDIVNVLLGPRPSKLIYYTNNQNNELVVVGNGPSLNISIRKNINWFNQKDILCVNSFCLTKLFLKFKPKYYAIMDPNILSKRSSRENRLRGNKIYNTLKNNVNWPMLVFLPMHMKNDSIFENISINNTNIKIIFVRTDNLNGPIKLKYYLYKINYAMPIMQNVLVSGIYIGLNKGYRKIYLVGADHSWLGNITVTGNNSLVLKNKHFYNTEISKRYMDTQEKNAFKMSDLLLAFHKMFKGYEELEKYSKHLNAKIYNASEQSYIDSFERYKIPKD